MLRILVVDDDPIFLTVADALLSSDGHDVVTLEKASAALDVIGSRDSDFGLIVTDLNMPDMDGLAFLRALAESKYQGPIALISGEKDIIRSSAGHFAEKLGLHIVTTLTKPLEPTRLAEALRLAQESAAPTPPVSPRGPAPAGSTDCSTLLHYQPQMDMHTGRIFGAEALVRGESHDGRPLGAEAVLALYETPTKRFHLTCHLFDLLCNDLEELTAVGSDLRLSFNIDAFVLEMPEFVPLLVSAANEGRVDASRITLELTERQLATDSSLLLERIARLGMSGYEIAMDDFGTGASNFELMRQGAFSEVKLDQSIVQSAEKDAVSERFVTYAVDLARTTGARIVAEGIETLELWEFVMKKGIRYGQGYHFARPETLAKLLQQATAQPPPTPPGEIASGSFRMSVRS